MALLNDGLSPYLDNFRQMHDAAKPATSRPTRRWCEMSEITIGEIAWERKQDSGTSDPMRGPEHRIDVIHHSSKTGRRECREDQVGFTLHVQLMMETATPLGGLCKTDRSLLNFFFFLRHGIDESVKSSQMSATEEKCKK